MTRGLKTCVGLGVQGSGFKVQDSGCRVVVLSGPKVLREGQLALQKIPCWMPVVVSSFQPRSTVKQGIPTVGDFDRSRCRCSKACTVRARASGKTSSSTVTYTFLHLNAW